MTTLLQKARVLLAKQSYENKPEIHRRLTKQEQQRHPYIVDEPYASSGYIGFILVNRFAKLFMHTHGSFIMLEHVSVKRNL